MNAKQFELRAARTADLPELVALLKSCELPTGDLGETLPGSFCVADVDGRIVGLAGVETFGDCALLRSLAVATDYRGNGLAARLVAWCEAEASRQGADTAYLLTTTAADYFRARGYTDVPRDAVPGAIAGHAQFRSLCPASAKCLKRSID